MLEVFNLLKVFLQVTAHVSGVKDCNCHDFSEIVHSSSGVFHDWQEANQSGCMADALRRCLVVSLLSRFATSRFAAS